MIKTTDNYTYYRIINTTLNSPILERDVTVDFYFPKNALLRQQLSLLFINDGQDMEKAGLITTLEKLMKEDAIAPLLIVAIHCGNDRVNEYGTAFITDYKGRGIKAKAYQQFIFNELIPYIRENFSINEFKEKAFAGFSLGGLSALDIVWNYAEQFSKVGVFSGSLWWRTQSVHEDKFEEDKDRIMHQQVRAGSYKPWLKFFFQCGLLDETEDRNNNGVIDSIDDTMDLIHELEKKGYGRFTNICYYEMPTGRHDVETWGQALPVFLKWGWGIQNECQS
jgi:enterochelin esterase-like enzyme